MPSVELNPTAFTMSVLNVPIPIRLSINLFFPNRRLSYSVKLTVSRSKEFFTLPKSIASLPSLIAIPNILLLAVFMSAPIVIALVFIFFAEEIIESPILPKLTVPSLQNDQLLAALFS